MRSVVVVLPASMCDVVPLLRWHSSGWLRAIFSASLDVLGSDAAGPSRYRYWLLPAVVAEGAVRFGHAVRILALLDGVAAVLRCVHQFTREARRHRLFRAGASRGDQPANGERLGALRTDLDRDLVGRAAD